METGRREAERCGLGREIFKRHTGKLSNCSPSGCAREEEEEMCALGGPLYRGIGGSGSMWHAQERAGTH